MTVTYSGQKLRQLLKRPEILVVPGVYDCLAAEGKRVIPIADHVGKIRAAVQARGESGLVIIARTDARAPLGLEEAITRGRAYIEAGADVLFVEAPQSVEELKAIATAFPDVPLVANILEGGTEKGYCHHALNL
jgi:methylisocitrate lyase